MKFPSALRLVGTVVGIVLVIGTLSALVAVALRRMRRRPREAAMVVEEREELASLRSLAGAAAGRLGRRLRSRLQRLRRQGPLSPGEVVRRRYAELERRLTKAGQPRPPGITVRDYLAAAAAAASAPKASTENVATVAPAAPDRPAEATPRWSAGELAAIYERARYSAHAVDSSQAERFASLALVFEA